MANNFAKIVNEIRKQAHANAVRCIMVWSALALREEGFGGKRIKRVLIKIHKYANQLNGKTTIDEQLAHIERITGLRIIWTSENEITIDEVKEIEEEYGEE